MIFRLLNSIPGFDDLPVLLQRLLQAAVMLLIVWLVVRLVRLILHRYWRGNRLLRVDPTYVNFIKNISTAAAYFVGFGIIIYSIPELRALWVSLLASAGILAAILGFASQQAFSNIISGMFLVLFKPIRVHDTIEIDQKYIGIVEDVTIRHVILRNTRNQRIVIPNSVLSSATIINYNLKDDPICSHVEFTFPPDTDFNRVLSMLRQLGEAHPLCRDYRTPEQIANEAPIVEVRIIQVVPTGVLVRAYVWSDSSAEAFTCRCDLYRDALVAFREAKIEVAFVRM
jgi:small-conductance mechanosensitive channel